MDSPISTSVKRYHVTFNEEGSLQPTIKLVKVEPSLSAFENAMRKSFGLHEDEHLHFFFNSELPGELYPWNIYGVIEMRLDKQKGSGAALKSIRETKLCSIVGQKWDCDMLLSLNGRVFEFVLCGEVVSIPHSNLMLYHNYNSIGKPYYRPMFRLLRDGHGKHWEAFKFYPRSPLPPQQEAFLKECYYYRIVFVMEQAISGYVMLLRALQNTILVGYIVSKKDLEKEAKAEYDSIVSKKKLPLILDLDKTLLICGERLVSFDFTINVRNGNRSHQQCVKLRPTVGEFLIEASKYFEIRICSLGTDDYLQKVIEQANNYNWGLGREREFIFNPACAISCRELQGNQKSLSMGFAFYLDDKSYHDCTVIIDDDPTVWVGFERNVILVPGFEGSSSGSRLPKILKMLKQIHHEYYSNRERDVRINIQKLTSQQAFSGSTF